MQIWIYFHFKILRFEFDYDNLNGKWIVDIGLPLIDLSFGTGIRREL